MSYTLYILKSISHNRYYIGCSTDAASRLQQHNAGKNKSTKPYRPWKVIYKEEYKEKRDAYKREWYLKHPRGYLEKLQIIKEYGEVA